MDKYKIEDGEIEMSTKFSNDKINDNNNNIVVPLSARKLRSVWKKRDPFIKLTPSNKQFNTHTHTRARSQYSSRDWSGANGRTQSEYIDQVVKLLSIFFENRHATFVGK